MLAQGIVIADEVTREVMGPMGGKNAVVPDTRPQTPDELLAVFRRALARLDKGIGAMDDGDPLGVDAVASTLRLLTINGRGDRLLRRARETFSLGEPPRGLSLTTAAPRSEPGLAFAVGAIPLPDSERAKEPHISTAEMLEERCLTISADDEQVSYKWLTFLAVVANKLGSIHSDADIPRAVDELSSYVIGGIPVLRYALRVVASVVATDAHHILDSIDGAHTPVRHTLLPEGCPWIGNVLVYGTIDTELDVRVNTFMEPGHNLVSWHDPGRIDWLFNPPELPDVPVPDRTNVPRLVPRAPRNAPCPCGSGKKYKFCHG